MAIQTSRLTLREPCPDCQGKGHTAVYNPDSDDIGYCPNCESTGQVLTDDGRAIAALVSEMLNTREYYQQSSSMRREEAQARRERQHQAVEDDLRRRIEQERWAREDLENKLRRGR